MDLYMLSAHFTVHLSLLFRLTVSTIFLLLLVVTPALAEKPIEVRVSLKLHQVTNINQKAENFSVVATLIMEWDEPELAAGPNDKKPFRMYRAQNLVRILEERGLLWPAHSFYNLQGRVDYQNRIARVDSKGKVSYIARFTATFQAPDFDFSQFPLDQQHFYIKLDSLPGESKILYKPVLETSGLGDSLGEEEWILEHTQTEVTTQSELGIDASRFILGFQGKRHLNYYFMRILIPVIIIILVSWFTFFLNDYTKRIDLTSGNLLLFIAFNFTIANDLPRLGYVTLMDTFLLATFATTGMVVLANVWLRRLQNHGRDVLAGKLDNIGIWAYPLLYIGGGFLMLLLFYK